MGYICWFNEIRNADVELVGGKGANLGEMSGNGFPVPPGFCLTAHAYRDFITSTGLDLAITAVLADTNLDEAEAVETATARIRELITAQSVPEDMALEILQSYGQLGQKLGLGDSATAVAVRSSATAEDLPTASFAGQQDTYLNIRGEAALLEHVKRCWASLWTARAAAYRARQGFEHTKVYLAVVVQAMIPSEVSGIMFTANPVDGARDVAVINASWGLGEAIVSGLVTPDTLIVSKSEQKILDRRIASKDLAIHYAPEGGVVEVEIPPEQRQQPALTDQQIFELVKIGSRIERHYDSPQDIEWAYAGGSWYVLQVRPITTLAADQPEAAPPDEYNRSMFVEIFPDPLSPVFTSVVKPLFQSMLDFTFRTWGYQTPQGIPAVGIFYNQPYFNRRYIEAAFKPLSPEVRNLLVDQVVNPFGDHKSGSQVEMSVPYLRMGLNTLRFVRAFPKLMPGLIATYHADVDCLSALPVEELSSAELVDEVRALVFGSTRQLLNYDFLLIAVIKRVYHLLGKMLEPYFGSDVEGLRGKLISGVTGNVTMETNIRLWDLAQLAKASPEVSRLLRQYNGQELVDQLEASADGRAFMDEVNKFLKSFGHREVRFDIIYPTWSEDPSPVFNFIRGYLDIGPDQDPHIQQKRLSLQRLEMKALVKERLFKDFKGRFVIWPLFRWLLDSIEFPTRERDTMHFEMTRIFPTFRRILFVVARRMVAQGVLSEEDEIFFLSLDELSELARAPKPVGEIVGPRRAEYELNKHRPWPNIIRGSQEIYAQDAGQAGNDANRLAGVPGSPGVITGRARVIRGPDEFHHLQEGDILVAPITNPVWTPLFAIASGVITEVGGILSHGAIVAREYGIPAVMSIASVTHTLQDGQMVTVDGDRGFVYLAAEAGV